VLDSHCCQVTPCSERKLEIVNLIKPGDWCLKGRAGNRGWRRLRGCCWFSGRLGLVGFGAVLGGGFLGGGLNLCLWSCGFCWGGVGVVAVVADLTAVPVIAQLQLQQQLQQEKS